LQFKFWPPTATAWQTGANQANPGRLNLRSTQTAQRPRKQAERDTRSTANPFKKWIAPPASIFDLYANDAFYGRSERIWLFIAVGMKESPLYADDGGPPWTLLTLEDARKFTRQKDRMIGYDVESLLIENGGDVERRGGPGPVKGYYRIWEEKALEVKACVERPLAQKLAAQKKATREKSATRAIAELAPPDPVTLQPGTEEAIALPEPALVVMLKNVDLPQITAESRVEGGVCFCEIRRTDPIDPPPPEAWPERETSAQEVRNPQPVADFGEAKTANPFCFQQNALNELLQPFALEYWGIPLDDTLLNRLTSTLGDTPVDVFNNRLNIRLKQGRIRSPGLLIKVAEDAVADWKKLKPIREAERAAAALEEVDEEVDAEPEPHRHFVEIRERMDRERRERERKQGR
jgi:hypothetical protein